jgi:hypothetical protein
VRVGASLLLPLLATAVLSAEPDLAPAVPEAPVPSPGDRGYMLTVVEGERIEEIPLSYIGVQRDLVGPGHHVHLVQLEGPVAERVGVAAGMSGSPVYFDGKLLGALAYRFGALPRDPVGGVTPLADMLGAERVAARQGGKGDPRVATIATPIQVAGLANEVREWLEPQLARLGFVTIAGGGRDPDRTTSDALRPGAPVGVELVRGDLSVVATGTVTHVDGPNVYAFGHPFLGGGSVELPMVSAAVVHTLADLAGSVKLSRSGNEVGAIVEDRLTAIVGRTGHHVRMIPLEVHIEGGDYGQQTLRFEVARNANLTPLLAAVSLANSLAANLGHAEETTMISAGTIRLAGLPPVPFELAAASGNGPDPAVGTAVRLQQILNSLWDNPFTQVELEGIELAVRVNPEVRRYSVERLHYDRGPLRPGQSFAVECRLRSYRGEALTRRFELRLPRELPPGDHLFLAVGPPDHIDDVRGRALARRFRTAADVQAMSGVLADLRSTHRLIALVYHDAPGIVSRGVAYADLPPSARRLLGSEEAAQRQATLRVSDLVEQELELDGPIDGGVVVRLQIDPERSPEEEGRSTR